jgi:hypothetical protein
MLTTIDEKRPLARIILADHDALARRAIHGGFDEPHDFVVIAEAVDGVEAAELAAHYVKSHVKHVLRNLGAHYRAEAVGERQAPALAGGRAGPARGLSLAPARCLSRAPRSDSRCRERC